MIISHSYPSSESPSSSAHFGYLFEALREFEPELRVQFLKFAFALSRLPSVSR